MLDQHKQKMVDVESNMNPINKGICAILKLKYLVVVNPLYNDNIHTHIILFKI